MSTELGIHLRKRRETLNEILKGEYSLRQVASRIGVSATYLSKIENGDAFPSEVLIESLAKELQESVAILHALRQKIPKDVERAIIENHAIVELVRAAASLSTEQIQQQAKRIREGEW